MEKNDSQHVNGTYGRMDRSILAYWGEMDAVALQNTKDLINVTMESFEVEIVKMDK